MAKGLVLINTGPGKGKTTAALGTAIRALGHGHRVVFLQFIKSSDTGESRFLEDFSLKYPELLFYQKLGLGFVKDKPTKEDLTAAQEAMEIAEKQRSQARLVVLDEINVALSKGLVNLDRVEAFITQRPDEQSIILTGRNCPKELYDLADTITEMTEIKHAYHQGIKAQKGVDF